MKNCHRLLITLFLSLAGCAEHPASKDETHACMEYRSMLTAPISPAAAQALREKCEQSRQ